MIIKDSKEVATKFFPKTAEQLKAEGEIKAILQFLETKFNTVPIGVKKKLEKVDNLKTLEQLTKLVGKVKSIEEFKKKLPSK